MLRQARFDRRGMIFLAVLIAAAVLVPVLSLGTPVGSPFHLSTYAVTLVGKYLCYALLALAPRPCLGLLRHPVPRPRRLLRARRLRHGHVPHAADRCARNLCQSGPAGFHGVSELAFAALHVVGLFELPLCHADGRTGAGAAGSGVRLFRLPVAGDGRLPVDHHAGHDLCVAARLLPQRHGVRRQTTGSPISRTSSASTSSRTVHARPCSRCRASPWRSAMSSRRP